MGSSTTHLPIDSDPRLLTTRSEGSMDEPVRGNTNTALVKTSRFFSAVVEFDKVPDDIQSCLDLVRTCHASVQKLIARRNEHIDLLTRRPNDLAHVNSVIESALGSLRDVAAIVERSWPQSSRGGRTTFTFAKRVRWTCSDKESFRKHLPLVNQHHNAVSSELAYLGQLGSTSTTASTGATPERNPSFGRVENRRNCQDMGPQFGNSTAYNIATTSVQTASITTTSSQSVSRDTTTPAPPPSYEQSTSSPATPLSNSVDGLPSPPSPEELSSNTDYTREEEARPQETETSNKSSIDASGLSMMLSDYAPLPETNTSVTIQNTVFHAPVSLVINVNSASGEQAAAQIAEDTRAAVQLSLRDLLGSGGMAVGSHPATNSPPIVINPGTKQPDVRKDDVVMVSETRGFNHGKQFVMRSGTTKSCVGKEVVMGPVVTNGSDFGKEVIVGSRANDGPLGSEHLNREPMNTFLPSPPPLPPKTPLPSPAVEPTSGLSYHAGLNRYDLMNKGSAGNVLESVFELPADPRGW
ncbi:hypothetical protein PG996_013828 [Apiospora saccharicola]|uniref:Uncharacterized protein n=1 Tax=Apiospora saccharicola TaxID=335842 RepID=A0ABR1TGL0_9PEZI